MSASFSAPAAPVSIWREVARLAGPALAQQGLLFAIRTYDQYLTGQFSPSHQAALTTANYIYWFVVSYAVVVTAGATALVARFVGAGDLPLARKAAGQAVLLAVGFGLFGGLVGVFGLPTLVDVLNLDGPSAEFAIAYLTPLAMLLPFYLIEVGGIACLVGAGDTKTGMYVLATAAVVNVPLATGLSSGWGLFPDLGFVGIAWGTGLSHVLGCGIVITVLIRGRYGLRLTWADVTPERGLMYRLLRVSIPAAADSLSIGVFQFVFLGLINRLGETAAAAHGIAIQLEALGYLSGSAFGVAAGSIVGRSLGAGRADLAARGGWTALLVGAAVMSAMGFLFFTFARPMFEIFCRSENQADVIEAGVPVLRLIAFAMPGLAGQIVLTQALRGAGDTRVPVLFTWAGFALVRLPLAYLLLSPEVGIELGLMGAWVAMFADIYVRGLCFLVRFAGGKWQATVV